MELKTRPVRKSIRGGERHIHLLQEEAHADRCACDEPLNGPNLRLRRLARTG